MQLTVPGYEAGPVQPAVAVKLTTIGVDVVLCSAHKLFPTYIETFPVSEALVTLTSTSPTPFLQSNVTVMEKGKINR